jgi:hydroxymethylpyrimidine pyrophosphatase-like HAD family hydrolase
MAFGDGNNDAEMFEFVNISVAMGNAKEELKKCATYITDDIDHDGIYNALIHFDLI